MIMMKGMDGVLVEVWRCMVMTTGTGIGVLMGQNTEGLIRIVHSYRSLGYDRQILRERRKSRWIKRKSG
jgi:hypothetical protein